MLVVGVVGVAVATAAVGGGVAAAVGALVAPGTVGELVTGGVVGAGTVGLEVVLAMEGAGEIVGDCVGGGPSGRIMSGRIPSGNSFPRGGPKEGSLGLSSLPIPVPLYGLPGTKSRPGR